MFRSENLERGVEITMNESKLYMSLVAKLRIVQLRKHSILELLNYI